MQSLAAELRPLSWSQCLPNSAAFIRIKPDILWILEAIPDGRIATPANIGRHPNVVPRQGDSILTILSHDGRALCPCDRVVAEARRPGLWKSN